LAGWLETASQSRMRCMEARPGLAFWWGTLRFWLRYWLTRVTFPAWSYQTTSYSCYMCWCGHHQHPLCSFTGLFLLKYMVMLFLHNFNVYAELFAFPIGSDPHAQFQVSDWIPSWSSHDPVWSRQGISSDLSRQLYCGLADLILGHNHLSGQVIGK
jgi:hypothetical protein